MYTAVQERPIVKLTASQFARIRPKGRSFVVYINPDTATAIGLDTAASVRYDPEADVDGLLGRAIEDDLDGRGNPHIGSVTEPQEKTSSTTVGIPGPDLAAAFDVDLDDVRNDEVQLYLEVYTAPGVILLRRPEVIEVDVERGTDLEVDAHE